MIGESLAHYKIVEKIGSGGQGEVYCALDAKLGRDVAVKVLPEAVAQSPERLARFEREAQLLASLNHPNIATVHDLEEANGIHYLVMELVPGETLAEILGRVRSPSTTSSRSPGRSSTASRRRTRAASSTAI